MSWSNFLRLVAYSFNPLQYKSIAEMPFKDVFRLVFRTFKISFLILLLLELPFFLSLPFMLSKELAYFSALDVSGSIERDSPLAIPQKNPHIVLDVRDGRKWAGEDILVTRDYMYFKTPFTAKKIRTEFLLKPLEHRVEAGQLVTVLMVLWLPSLFLLIYFALLIKYSVFLILASILAIVIVRGIFLSHTPMHRIVNMVMYAAIPVILIEVISIPFDSSYLIPVYDFFGLSFNLGTLIIYLVLLSSGAFLAEKEIAVQIHERRHE